MVIRGVTDIDNRQGINNIERLVDGTIVRKEPFGFFMAFPDGEMGFFDSSASSLIRLAAVVPVPKEWLLLYRTHYLQNSQEPDWNYVLNHPLIVSIELTRECNCACELCYIGGGKPRQNELTHEQQRSLWQQLVQAKACCIQLTGGEPLLHPLVLEAISYFHTHGVVASLVTNGTLLTKEFVRKLPHSDFGMGLSIDSYFSNQNIRGDIASFNALEPKVKLLKDEGIPFNIVTTLSKLNIRDVLALIEWCRKNDVMLETLEAQPLGRANANSHLLLTADDLPMDAKIYRAKEDLEDEYEDRHERKGRFFAGFLQAGYQYASLTGRCKGSRAIAYVSSDGTLYPCSNCAGEGILSAGNVTHTSFEQLWHEGFSEMRSICWKDFQECMDCELSISPYYCGSRCPALSYVKTGEFLKPGCSPYMRGAVLQRTRIHDEMHAAQEKISFRSKK